MCDSAGHLGSVGVMSALLVAPRVDATERRLAVSLNAKRHELRKPGAQQRAVQGEDGRAVPNVGLAMVPVGFTAGAAAVDDGLVVLNALTLRLDGFAILDTRFVRPRFALGVTARKGDSGGNDKEAAHGGQR